MAITQQACLVVPRSKWQERKEPFPQWLNAFKVASSHLHLLLHRLLSLTFRARCLVVRSPNPVENRDRRCSRKSTLK
ncbi:hypothetical protein CGRA01v4_06921 [Colletotrichum graminicola]|nr:hypothetical protein CGRA01v4_06921 [Colletotrichum graminicola]